jgi:hypothetical protein
MFMELVRGDRTREPLKFADERIYYLGRPRILAQCLDNLMRNPSNDARFRWLKEELESKQDLPTSEPSERRRQVDLLTERFCEEMAAMLREKMADQIEIIVAPVNLPWRYGDSEGPIQELPQFAVTETAYFDDDGLLRQSPNSNAAWRCYGISAKACVNGSTVSVGSDSERHAIYKAKMEEQSANEEMDVATLDKRRKANSGRKPTFVDAHWRVLKTEAFRLLDHYGGLSKDDPEFNSKNKFIAMLLAFAQNNPRFKDVGAPERTSMQPYVDLWLREWEALRAA